MFQNEKQDHELDRRFLELFWRGREEKDRPQSFIFLKRKLAFTLYIFFSLLRNICTSDLEGRGNGQIVWSKAQWKCNEKQKFGL